MSLAALGFFIAAMLLAAPVVSLSSALAQPCEPQTFEETRFIVCTWEPGKAELRLFWKNGEDEPYRYFSNVADAVRAEGRTLTFAVNAGMYLSDFSPLGLYIENGHELRPANTAQMMGSVVPNFYKKPNGVFFVQEQGAGILPTDDYLKRGLDVRFATQSGPLLVIENRLNPIFIPGSSDRTRRSGVGECGGTVRFAISEDAVNFHDFARLFRDQLKCTNALFLDGGGGVGIYAPALERNDMSLHGGFGPILGLVER
ncbi:hypothetical protein A6U87_13690 [Rhizobium sp. AC44/96]|uniref:phosphodiester glycosidase family protein n=1 Tax=Rhizobium sp. AC44/96 TaxID=1841654 RepID=UPI00081006AA|nr:phosphodiester glycosidase family protein [Rhizobium sp. AC44/96]OCJ05073.1 hypothetical protein A6U87_13690 [Rhizobium sp. AC44/96]